MGEFDPDTCEECGAYIGEDEGECSFGLVDDGIHQPMERSHLTWLFSKARIQLGVAVAKAQQSEFASDPEIQDLVRQAESFLGSFPKGF